MEPYFLDTNIILRYVTQADPSQPHLVQQAQQARAILSQVETGSITVITSEGVIIEAVQVLSSKVLYNLPRQDIQRHLTNILRLRGLKIANKRTYLRALDLYAGHSFLDFVDALNIAHMERAKTGAILSFDRDFDRIPGVTRQERT